MKGNDREDQRVAKCGSEKQAGLQSNASELRPSEMKARRLDQGNTTEPLSRTEERLESTGSGLMIEMKSRAWAKKREAEMQLIAPKC